jgi:CubicO group peptidase (beta-lactamase class C family)/tetratricopeptide (TPR) repeat protein
MLIDSSIKTKSHVMRKNLSFAIILSLLWLWAAGLLLAQDAGEIPQSPFSIAIKTYEGFVEEHMAFDRITGISVGFLKDDFVWARGFGFADLENRVPVKPESSFRMASITKTFTAIAILQLVEAGKVDLDVEVQSYVPTFPRKKWPITIRQLLAHLGGIRHYKDDGIEEHIKVHKKTREALAIFQDSDLVAEPGTKYHYSSYGYDLLGAVIEEVSGKTYGDYIKEHIFLPLGMENSLMDDPTALIPNRVKGYRLVNGQVVNSEYVDISSRFAAGGTRSTVLDLLKYARGIMDGKLLKKETWPQMFIPMATRGGILTGKGLCWDVGPWNGHFQISHGGRQPETRTFLVIFPKESFAIAIASNFEAFDRLFYVKKLAEYVLDEDMDRTIYVSDPSEAILYSACSRVFSYGLSHFERADDPVTRDKRELADAFSYLNKHMSIKALNRNKKRTRGMIQAGIHPVSGEAFTKAGSFMASVLEERFGRESLQQYRKKGPIAFFSDYINISQDWDSSKEEYKFKRDFSKLVFSWVKGWDRVYAGDIQRLSIPLNADYESLSHMLKNAFAGASLYPDHHRDLERTAQHYLEKNDIQKSFQFLGLSTHLYPRRAAPLSSLARIYLWMGNLEKAGSSLKKAFSCEPEHPSLHPAQLAATTWALYRAGKEEASVFLAEVASELYPKSWELHVDLGNIFLGFGNRDYALHYFRGALRLNPELKDVRNRIDEMIKNK